MPIQLAHLRTMVNPCTVHTRSTHHKAEMADSRIKKGWARKSHGEREQALKTVRVCGSRLMPWKETASMLGVHVDTLWQWRRADPKINIMYAMGRADLGAKLSDRLIGKALAGGVVKDEDGVIVEGEEGNTSALIHLSKRVLDLGDKQTNINIDPTAPAAQERGADAEERFYAALQMLNIEGLVPRPEKKVEDEDEGEELVELDYEPEPLASED